jgi:hypothetical protein
MSVGYPTVRACCEDTLNLTSPVSVNQALDGEPPIDETFQSGILGPS